MVLHLPQTPAASASRDQGIAITCPPLVTAPSSTSLGSDMSCASIGKQNTGSTGSSAAVQSSESVAYAQLDFDKHSTIAAAPLPEATPCLE